MAAVARAAAALALAACATSLDVADGGFDVQPLVADGAAAPSGEPFIGFGALRLNAHGDLLFEARVATSAASARGGLFVASGGRIEAVALQGEPTPIGGHYLRLGYAALNDRREVAFITTIERPHGDRVGPRAAILVARDAGPSVAVRLRDQAPDEGIFTAFSDLALGPDGSLAFVGGLDESEAPGGLFVAAGGILGRVAAILDPTPAGGHFREISTPSLGAGGNVAFHASVSEDGQRSGIFVASRRGVHRVVATGDATPLGGRFGHLANPVLGIGGRLYFWGQVRAGRALAGLFVRNDGGALRPLAIGSAPSPSGAAYAFLGIQFAAADAVAFEADLDGTPPVSAILLASNGEVRPVVQTGSRAPDGGVFTEFGGFAINARNELAFVGVAGGRTTIYRAMLRRRG